MSGLRNSPPAGRSVASLSRRSRVVLSTLTHYVRFLSEAQLAHTFWRGQEATAASYLRLLAKTGWVQRAVLLSHPEIDLHGPLLTWKPGEPAPPFSRLSYLCKRRWNRPPVQIPVWLATPKAGTLFGGSAGFVP